MSYKPKSSSRKAAEIMVRDYYKNIELIRMAEDEAINSSPSRPEIAISGKGRIHDETARRSALLSTKEIRRKQEEVAAVQYAFGRCKVDKRQGDKIKRIIDLVYWKGTHTMFGAAVAVGVTSEWAGRLAGRFFDWVDIWFKIE